jgi:hypothetical protein
LVIYYLSDGMCRGSIHVTGEQLQKEVQSWLSPPDPSKNHNIAWASHHGGTATWFTQGIFQDWKERGSLLWIHGKCT